MKKIFKNFSIVISFFLVALFFALAPSIQAQTVTVGTPPPPPASTKFVIGDTVAVTTNGANTRPTPAGANPVFVQGGTEGTVLDGPVVATLFDSTTNVSTSYVWWKVSFIGGITGWSAENYLTKVDANSPPPPPPAGSSSDATQTLQATLKINGLDHSKSPITLPIGQDINFAWTSGTGSVGCYLDPHIGGVTPNGSVTAKYNTVLYPYTDTYESRTYRLTCTDGGSRKGVDTITVTPPSISVNSAPTSVNLKASVDGRKTWQSGVNGPIVVTAGEKLFLTWRTTNTSSCSFGSPLTDYNNNVWPMPAEYYQLNPNAVLGNNPLFGYIQWWATDLAHYPVPGTSATYTLTCTGGILPDGTDSPSASDSITLKNDTPAVPIVDLKINNSDGPTINLTTAQSAQPITLTWNLLGAVACNLTGSGIGDMSLSGKTSITLNPGDAGYPDTSGSIFNLTCHVAGPATPGYSVDDVYSGNIKKSDIITIYGTSAPAAPTVSLNMVGSLGSTKSNGQLVLKNGESLILKWDSNITNGSCALGNPFNSTLTPQMSPSYKDSGYPYPPGNMFYPAATWRYSLTCTNAAGVSATDTEVVGVGSIGTIVTPPQNPTLSIVPLTPPATPSTPTSPPSISPAAQPANGTPQCTNLSTVIAEGSTGADVILLQNFLKAQGFLSGVADGKFGPITAAAVSAFQSANGIDPVGSVGPITRAKISAISCGSSVTNPGTIAITPPCPAGMVQSGNSCVVYNASPGTTGGSSSVSLKANSTSGSINIGIGDPVTLSWTVSNQASCFKSSTPASEFTGALVPVGSGHMPVYPLGRIEYKITCGDLSSRVVVNVGSDQSGNSGAVSVGALFSVGDTVSSTVLLNVHSIANITASIITTVPAGTTGTVWGGPVAVNGQNWWNISFPNVAIGWSVENYLTKVASGGLSGGTGTSGGVARAGDVKTTIKIPTNLATCPTFDITVSQNIEKNGQIPNPSVVFILPSGWTYNKNVVPNTLTVPGRGTLPSFPNLPVSIDYNYAVPTSVGCGGFLFSDNTIRNAAGVLLRDFKAEGQPTQSIGAGKTSDDVLRNADGTPLIIGQENICAMAGTPAGTLCDNFLQSNGVSAPSLPPGCTSTSGFSTTTGQPCSGGSNLPAGCTSTAGFSPTTGLSCSGSTTTVTTTTTNTLATTLKANGSTTPVTLTAGQDLVLSWDLDSSANSCILSGTGINLFFNRQSTSGPTLLAPGNSFKIPFGKVGYPLSILNNTTTVAPGSGPYTIGTGIANPDGNTYTLNCNDFSGTNFGKSSINVKAATSTPYVDIQAGINTYNFSDGPVKVTPSGWPITLAFAAANLPGATTCSLNFPYNNFLQNKYPTGYEVKGSVSGTFNLGSGSQFYPTSSGTTYTFACTAPDGSNVGSDSVLVTN